VTALPHYYTRLGPFEEVFRTGLPILTYHHVGPRARGARLKGLYVSPRLFENQMLELKADGFLATELGQPIPARNEPRRIVITFDDGFRDVFENALPVLAMNGLQAIVYLVSGQIGGTNQWQQSVGDVPEPLMDEGQIREWIAAGQRIGSHTASHPWLTRIDAATAKEEISSSRRSLEDRFGVAIQHFCYPYGDWNERVRDLVAEAGYSTACTTKTGINPAGQPPLELKRFTARYQSRNLETILARILGR
jgi:peptidoglycan/xylan/chitin deacetylase (PgdA/CDA1 family)